MMILMMTEMISEMMISMVPEMVILIVGIYLFILSLSLTKYDISKEIKRIVL